MPGTSSVFREASLTLVPWRRFIETFDSCRMRVCRASSRRWAYRRTAAIASEYCVPTGSVAFSTNVLQFFCALRPLLSTTWTSVPMLLPSMATSKYQEESSIRLNGSTGFQNSLHMLWTKLRPSDQQMASTDWGLLNWPSHQLFEIRIIFDQNLLYFPQVWLNFVLYKIFCYFNFKLPARIKCLMTVLELCTMLIRLLEGLVTALFQM